MFGIPNLYLIAGAVLAVVLSFFAGDYHGYSVEHAKFMAFEAQVKAIGEEQKRHVAEVTKEQAAVTENVKSDYEAKIAKIHEAYAGAQEATVAAVTQSTKEGVQSDYESKIASLHKFYGDTVGRVFNAGSSRSNVSGVSAASSRTDAATSDAGLAERCAMTTQELVSLQAWVAKQVAIK